MWRFLLLGMLPVGTVVATVALDDQISWSHQFTQHVLLPMQMVFVPPPLPDDLTTEAPPPPAEIVAIGADLIEARDLIDENKITEARSALLRMQLRLAARPIMLNQRQFAVIQVRAALHALSIGDKQNARQTINQILDEQF